MNSLSARLKEVLAEKQTTAYVISKATGISEATIGRLLKGVNKPNNATVSSIATYLGITSTWLQTGEGSKYVEEKKSKIVSNAVEIRIPDDEREMEVIREKEGTEFRALPDGYVLMLTPLVEQFAYAGYTSGWADSVYIDELPKHPVIVKKVHFGVYRSFQVRGDSMSYDGKDSIYDGWIVTGRRLDRKYWRSKLHYTSKPDWVIVQKDGIIIKRIINHKVEEGRIEYKSLNPDKDLFPNTEVSLDDIQELYSIEIVTQMR